MHPFAGESSYLYIDVGVVGEASHLQVHVPTHVLRAPTVTMYITNTMHVTYHLLSPPQVRTETEVDWGMSHSHAIFVSLPPTCLTKLSKHFSQSSLPNT